MKRLMITLMTITLSSYGMLTTRPEQAKRVVLKENSFRDIGHWIEAAFSHATREFSQNVSLLNILKQLQQEYSEGSPEDVFRYATHQTALVTALNVVTSVNRDPRVIKAKSFISRNPCIYKKTCQPIFFDRIARETEIRFPMRESDNMVAYHDLISEFLATNQHVSSADSLITYLVAKHTLEEAAECDDSPWASK